MPEAASDSGSGTDRQQRILVHIPIVHSQADMGSYQEQVRHAYIQQAGEKAWRDSRRAIAAFWDALEEKILSLDLDWSRLRIYQDALPVCGHEANIVHDLAGTGAANYRILQVLTERGAILEGTENPQLLLREKDLLNAGTGRADSSGGRADGKARDEATTDLLRARDRFIADRIDETLKPGEVGMLFIGALHHVTSLLPGTIKVMGLEEFGASLPRP